MAISNEQYDEIMREYEERRRNSRHTFEEHRSEVYELIPEYEKLDNRVAQAALDSAIAALGGDADAQTKLSEEYAQIEERKRKLLEDFAFPADYLEMSYTCPDCKDTGYIDGQKCHCLRQAILRRLYKQSNIESVLEVENFDTLTYDYYEDSEIEQMREIVGRCKKYVADFDGAYENILFFGSVGVGKTFLSNCIAGELLRSGHSVIYFTAMQLFDTLKEYTLRANDFEYEESSFLSDILGCDLLIIDDLGTEKTTEFIISQLFRILNERDMRKKSTIISTNLEFSQLADRYSERTFSRVFGNYTMIRPDIDDIRMKKKQLQQDT